MQFASPSRRALGLMAVSTIGMTTAVLGVTGVAQAAVPTYIASGSGVMAPVPAGICAIDWVLNGGAAGLDSDGELGGAAGYVSVVLPAAVGDVYTLNPGGPGGNGVGSTPGAGGTSEDSDPTTQGSAGTTDGSASGGGGGAASTVQKGSTTILQAYGADAFDGNALGGLGGGDAENFAVGAPDEFDPNGYDSSGQPAEIYGEGIPCAPGTPYLEEWIQEGDGSLTIEWHAPTNGDIPPTGYEYTLDDSATWVPITGAVNTDGRFSKTITGLTNETEYTIQIRAVGGADSVPGLPGAERTGTPFKPVGAPTGVVVTPGPSALTVTWGEAAAGGSPVAGYVVELTWHRGEMGGGSMFCETGADGRSCTGAATPGATQDVHVYAVDGEGRHGERVRLTSGVVPASATVPTSNGDLTPAAGSTGPVSAGTKVTLSGTGYAANSLVTLLIYSEPQVLTTVVTDGTGSFTVEVTVPDGLAAGQHTLVASGVDGLGNVRTMTLPVTVAGGTTGAGGLAYTGVDIAGPAIGGLAALAVGAGLLVASRRRSAA